MNPTRRLGDYDLVRELGRGAYGVVFEARHRRLPRPFAIKLLLHAEDATDEARFAREARIASRLEDPAIVGVYGIGRDPQGRPYFVMELCPGPTLRERLREGPLLVAEALRLVAELARAVEVAHAAGVIHRDLKPDNVILDARTGRPRLTDFGVAHDRSVRQSLTRTGDVLGTPLYMAPEQLRAERRVDRRADVYALGAILFRCLTGREVDEAATLVDLLLKHGEPAPAPSSLRSGLPAAVDRICARALARDPEERTPSAGALQAELEAAAATLDPPAAPDPDGGRSPRSARRRALVSLAALLALGGLALGAAELWRRTAAGPTPPTTDVAAPPRESPVGPGEAGGGEAAADDTPPAEPWQWSPPAPEHAALREALGATVADSGCDASLLVLDEAGRTVYELKPRVLRPPGASAQLATAAAALELLDGASFTTELRTPTSPSQGVVGDLVVIGSGDPMLTSDDLEAWAAAVERWGVRRIAGDLILDGRRFPGPARHPDAPEPMRGYYDAPATALAVADACVNVARPGTRRGRSAPFVLRPHLAAMRVEEGTGASSVVRGPEGGWRAALEGGLGPGDDEDVPVADPSALFGALLAERLTQAGIHLQGSVRPAGLAEDFSAWSTVPGAGCVRPVVDVVRQVGRRSQGWYAGCLFRRIGAETGEGTWAGAARAVTDVLSRAFGAAPEEVVLQDGSGLAPGNRLTAAALMAVLWSSSERRSLLVETLNALPQSLNAGVGNAGWFYNLRWYAHRDARFALTGVTLRAQAGGDGDSASLAGVLEGPGGRRFVVALAEGAPRDQLRARLLAPVLDRLFEDVSGSGVAPRAR